MNEATPARPSEDERWELLENLDAVLDRPLTVLSLVWLGLLLAEFITGLGRELQALTLILWGLFILDYLLELWIAPDRLGYLRSHWIGAIALALPALRLLAIFRAFRALRSLRLVRTVSLGRTVTSTNRALKAVRSFLGARQLGYVLTSYLLVMVSGGAAIHFLEGSGESASGGLRNFGDALWWSAMMMTTMGSDYWPHTWEGRVIAWLLAVYAFVVFGYITASLASHFIRSESQARRR
jgi:voltage-gated potassium channel